MKARMLKVLLTIGVLGSMVFSLSACQQKEQEVVEEKKPVIEDMAEEEVATFGFDFLGGKDVMPIGGYYGPAASIDAGDGRIALDHYTDEVFKDIADSGVNLLLYPNANYTTSKSTVIKQLELGGKYNIGVYVCDSKIYEPDANAPISIADLDKRLAEYCDYPAFCGVYVIDEPTHPLWTTDGAKHVSRFADIYTKLGQLNITGSVNLGPMWNANDAENYKTFVDELCSTCDPKYLCFDHYVWDGGRTKDIYFYNMSIIREYAEKYNIPWWNFVQAGGSWNDGGARFDAELYPNEGQFNWDVHTSLACGAKGVSYFPLIQPLQFAWAESQEFDFNRNGLLGAMGNKTQWWYYAQKQNQQIKAVDGVLMNAVNKGILVTSEQAKADTKDFSFVLEGDSWRELKSVKGNAMIGCFNYKGKTALYVVNYDYENAQIITLNLHDVYKMQVTQEAKLSRVEGDKLKLNMKAGEGALIVFE